MAIDHIGGSVHADETVRRLRSEIRLLERRLDRYVALAERIATAEYFDFTVYEQAPSAEWVAIHRSDLHAIVAAADCAAQDLAHRSVVPRQNQGLASA